MKIKTLRPEFLNHFPERLEEGVLYISEEFAIAGHKCCCGCGEEVITPLNRAQWQIRRENASVSLYPSIGNWKFSCKSHYWIRRSQVIDALPMSKRAINSVFRRDRSDKDLYIQQRKARLMGESSPVPAVEVHSSNLCSNSVAVGILKRLRSWWRNKD